MVMGGKHMAGFEIGADLAFRERQRREAGLTEDTFGSPLYEPEPEPGPFRLSVQDASSPAWKNLRKQIITMLVEQRKLNDFPMSELETAGIRGKIELLKEFLEFDGEPLTSEEDLASHYAIY